MNLAAREHFRKWLEYYLPLIEALAETNAKKIAARGFASEEAKRDIVHRCSDDTLGMLSIAAGLFELGVTFDPPSGGRS